MIILEIMFFYYTEIFNLQIDSHQLLRNNNNGLNTCFSGNTFCWGSNYFQLINGHHHASKNVVVKFILT